MRKGKAGGAGCLSDTLPEGHVLVPPLAPMRFAAQTSGIKSIPSTGCRRPSLRAAGFQGGVGNLERPSRYRSAFNGVHRQHRYGTLARGPRRADQVESDTGLCRSQDFRRRRACGPGNCSIPEAELKRPEPDHSLIGFGARVNDRVRDFPAIPRRIAKRLLTPGADICATRLASRELCRKRREDPAMQSRRAPRSAAAITDYPNRLKLILPAITAA